MTGLINEAAMHWWNWVAPMFWQVALLIVVVGFLDLALRRWVWPRLRYALWLLVLVKLVLPPSLSSPASLTAGIFQTGNSGPSVMMRVQGDLSSPDKTGNESLLASGKASRAGTAQSPATTADAAARHGALLLQGVLMGVWFCGATLLGWWAAVRFRRLRREFRAVDPPPAYGELLRSLATQLKLRRLPGLAFSSTVSSPAVFGVFRPIVVLPDKYREGTPDESARYALLHELAHVKRGDLIIHAAFMALQILYWFHPLLWWVRRRMQHARELCCDATVAGVLEKETREYRNILLATAERLLSKSPLPAPEGLGFLGLIERPGDLLSRLHWLEKDTGRRSRLRTAVLVTAVTAMVAMVLPMGKYGAADADGSGPEGFSNRAGSLTTSGGYVTGSPSTRAVETPPGEVSEGPDAAEPKQQILIQLCLVEGPEETLRAFRQKLAPAVSGVGRPDRTPEGEAGPPTDVLTSAAIIMTSWTKLQEAIRHHADLKTLVSPNVTVEDGQRAEVFVGMEVPIPRIPGSTDERERRSQPERKMVGTSFHILVETLEADALKIDLTYETSAIVDWKKTGPFLRKVRIPIIQSRKSKTKLALRSGRIAMLETRGVKAVSNRSGKRTAGREETLQLLFFRASLVEETRPDLESSSLGL